MVSQPLPALITSGTIAAELHVPLHRVLWVLKSRRDIAPAATAGRVRLYRRSAIARVRYELNVIDSISVVSSIANEMGDKSNG